jgi:hypothetical protein
MPRSVRLSRAAIVGITLFLFHFFCLPIIAPPLAELIWNFGTSLNLDSVLADSTVLLTVLKALLFSIAVFFGARSYLQESEITMQSLWIAISIFVVCFVLGNVIVSVLRVVSGGFELGRWTLLGAHYTLGDPSTYFSLIAFSAQLVVPSLVALLFARRKSAYV